MFIQGDGVEFRKLEALPHAKKKKKPFTTCEALSIHLHRAYQAIGISPMRSVVSLYGTSLIFMGAPHAPRAQTGPWGGGAAELCTSSQLLMGYTVASMYTGQAVLLNGAAPSYLQKRPGCNEKRGACTICHTQWMLILSLYVHLCLPPPTPPTTHTETPSLSLSFFLSIIISFLSFFS